jgi:hypothetical protein
MAFTGINELAANGIQYGYWYVLNGAYPYGTTGTIANNASAGGGRIPIKSIEVTEPTVERLFPTGNNSTLGVAFTLQPNELPTGALTMGGLDQTFVAKSNDLVLDTWAGWDVLGFGPQCYSFSQMMFVLNSPAKSLETATLGESGWLVTVLMKVENFATTMATMTERAVHEWANALTFSKSSTLPWGTPFTTADNNSTAFVGVQFSSDYPVSAHTYVSDGTTTPAVFTLDLTPVAASANAVMVVKNGATTPLAYTTDYTVNATTKVVSLVSPGAAGDKFVVFYKHTVTC